MRVEAAKTSYPTYRGVPIEASNLAPEGVAVVYRLNRTGGEAVWKMIQCREPCALASDLSRWSSGLPLRKSWRLVFLDAEDGGRGLPMVMERSGDLTLRAGASPS